MTLPLLYLRVDDLQLMRLRRMAGVGAVLEIVDRCSAPLASSRCDLVMRFDEPVMLGRLWLRSCCRPLGGRRLLAVGCFRALT